MWTSSTSWQLWFSHSLSDICCRPPGRRCVFRYDRLTFLVLTGFQGRRGFLFLISYSCANNLACSTFKVENVMSAATNGELVLYHVLQISPLWAAFAVSSAVRCTVVAVAQFHHSDLVCSQRLVSPLVTLNLLPCVVHRAGCRKHYLCSAPQPSPIAPLCFPGLPEQCPA